ncbi:hypothetical protein L9F63_009206, partial [Diploptera punctata]
EQPSMEPTRTSHSISCQYRQYTLCIVLSSPPTGSLCRVYQKYVVECKWRTVSHARIITCTSTQVYKLSQADISSNSPNTRKHGTGSQPLSKGEELEGQELEEIGLRAVVDNLSVIIRQLKSEYHLALFEGTKESQWRNKIVSELTGFFQTEPHQNVSLQIRENMYLMHDAHFEVTARTFRPLDHAILYCIGLFEIHCVRKCMVSGLLMHVPALMDILILIMRYLHPVITWELFSIIVLLKRHSTTGLSHAGLTSVRKLDEHHTNVVHALLRIMVALHRCMTATRHLDKGSDLLEEAGQCTNDARPSSSNSGGSGLKDLARSLKQHLRGFSERLEDTRERLEDTSRCFYLLDKEEVSSDGDRRSGIQFQQMFLTMS